MLMHKVVQRGTQHLNLLLIVGESSRRRHEYDRHLVLQFRHVLEPFWLWVCALVNEADADHLRTVSQCQTVLITLETGTNGKLCLQEACARQCASFSTIVQLDAPGRGALLAAGCLCKLSNASSGA
jgi:hypothetical protein